MSLPDSNLSDVQVADTVYLERGSGGFQARYTYIPMEVVKVTKTQITAKSSVGQEVRYSKSTGQPVGTGRDAWSRAPRIYPATAANTARARDINAATAEHEKRSKLRYAIIDMLKDEKQFNAVHTDDLDAAHAALCGMETVTTATEETN